MCIRDSLVSPTSLSGRAAVVTGGGGGIGSATGAALARAGASVLLVDRDAAALVDARQRVREGSVGEATVETFEADVSESEQVQAYVAKALAELGTIDVFFNNAGIEGPVAALVDYPEEEFDRVISVNLRGIFLGLKYVLPVMLAQGSGSIINTGSIASARGLPNTIGYNAAKHAVLGMTRSAASEYAETGVRINAVLPGMIDTRLLRSLATTMADGDTEGGLAGAAAAAPANRLGSPEEIAGVVAFLASDAASFVNGAGWSVDGGALAGLANGS